MTCVGRREDGRRMEQQRNMEERCSSTRSLQSEGCKRRFRFALALAMRSTLKERAREGKREREGEEAHTVSRGNGRRRGSLAGRTDFSTLFLQNRISDLNCEPSFVPPFIDSLPQTRAQRLESRESALRVSRVHSRTLRLSDSRGCVLDASGGKERV